MAVVPVPGPGLPGWFPTITIITMGLRRAPQRVQPAVPEPVRTVTAVPTMVRAMGQPMPHPAQRQVNPAARKPLVHPVPASQVPTPVPKLERTRARQLLIQPPQPGQPVTGTMARSGRFQVMTPVLVTLVRLAIRQVVPVQLGPTRQQPKK